MTEEDVSKLYTRLAFQYESAIDTLLLRFVCIIVSRVCGWKFPSGRNCADHAGYRNHIKSYAESFGKSKRKVASIDQEQDMNFKSQLKFNFLKSWNIHLNLVAYWTEDHHIIGNTQQLPLLLPQKIYQIPKWERNSMT